MRLLLAEDEKSLSRALITILERNGYSADPAFDGESALHALESGNYDAAILDIMMPKLDGIAVLKKIRADGNLMPVLMLTAKSEIDDKVVGLDTGANDYLTKPFDSKELLARIRSMTRTQSEPLCSRLRMGNVTLDRSGFELSTPSGSFRLANKEFQMMEFLMSNPKSAINAARFMEKMWNNDKDADDSIVWLYISYLSKKLNALHANIRIQSDRKAGYYLEEMP